MARLPNVNALVEQITAKAHAVETEKVAAANPPRELVVPVAQEIQKLAHSIRAAGEARLSYSDVQEFAARLGGGQ